MTYIRINTRSRWSRSGAIAVAMSVCACVGACGRIAAASSGGDDPVSKFVEAARGRVQSMAKVTDDKEFLDAYERYLETLGLQLRWRQGEKVGIRDGFYLNVPTPGSHDWQLEWTQRVPKKPGDDGLFAGTAERRLDVPQGKSIVTVSAEDATVVVDGGKGSELHAVCVRCSSGRVFVVDLDSGLASVVDP